MRRTLDLGPNCPTGPVSLRLVPEPVKSPMLHSYVMTNRTTPEPSNAPKRRDVLLGAPLLHALVRSGETLDQGTKVLMGFSNSGAVKETARVLRGRKCAYVTTVYDARLIASATNSRFLCVTDADFSGGGLTLTGHLYRCEYLEDEVF